MHAIPVTKYGGNHHILNKHALTSLTNTTHPLFLSPTRSRYPLHNRKIAPCSHIDPNAAVSSASQVTTVHNANSSLLDNNFFDRTSMLLKAKEIISFALPVIIVPLADPIMSLVDTICLGQLAGALHVASISPASLIFNFSFYSMTALSIATVSLTSERLRTGKNAGDIASTSLFAGTACGFIIFVILQCFGSSLLISTGCDPTLLEYSTQYLKIRSYAAPATIITMISQAAFLGQRNSTTPLKIVIASILLSLVGDLFSIGKLSLGIAGAAWTTVVAQYFSAVLLLHGLQRSIAPPPLRLPSLADLKELFTGAAALGIFFFAKTTSYLFLSATAARLPAMQLAAHTAVWQLWGLCSFFNTPLEQASLAFLPAARSMIEQRQVAFVLLSIGTMLGLVCSIIAHGIPYVTPSLLLADSSLWGAMHSVWLPGSIAMICCGMDVSSTGVLIASKDMGFVVRSMIISMISLVSFLWGANKVALIYGVAWKGWQLSMVWWGLAVFFVARAGQSIPRLCSRYFFLNTKEEAYQENTVITTTTSGGGGEEKQDVLMMVHRGQDSVDDDQARVLAGEISLNAT